MIDPLGRVHAYARPIALRRDGVRRVTPGMLGAAVAREAVPVGRIAFLRYRDGAAWKPRTPSAGEALLDLLWFTLAARRRFDLASRTLRLVAVRAEALEGARGAADDAARELIAGMAGRGDPPQDGRRDG